jgi:hypothetical protein
MRQFFEDNKGELSMTRLLCFLSFWPASYVVIMDRSEQTLAWYLGTFALSYLGGKSADVISAIKGKP